MPSQLRALASQESGHGNDATRSAPTRPAGGRARCSRTPTQSPLAYAPGMRFRSGEHGKLEGGQLSKRDRRYEAPIKADWSEADQDGP